MRCQSRIRAVATSDQIPGLRRCFALRRPHPRDDEHSCYRDDSDPNAYETAAALHEAYPNWARANRCPALTSNALGRKLKALGFEDDKDTAGNRIRRRVRLKSEAPRR